MGEPKMEESICVPVSPIHSSLQNQIIASVICSAGSFAFGCQLGWLSPVIDDLQRPSGGPLDAPMTETELSWAGGLLCCGALLGLPLFNVVAKSKGRKPSAYVAGIPIAIAAVIKIYAESSLWMLVSQFILGMGGAAAISLPPLYVSEICEPRGRGALSSIIMVQYSFGVFTSYVIGALVSYELHTALQLVSPLLFLLAFWFMPETPLFRLKKGEEEAAARAIAWLRKLPLNGVAVRTELLSLARQIRGADPIDTTYEPTKEDLIREMEYLISRLPQHPDAIHKRPIEFDDGYIKKQSAWRALISSRAALRGLTICIALIIAQTVMGLAAFAIYASVVFEAVHLKVSTDVCSIIYSITLIIGCGVGSVMMDYAGRRILQISSCFIVCIGEAILGVFFYASQNEYAPDWLSWVALVSLVACVIAYNSGAATVVFVLLAEYFATEVRDLANNIVMYSMWVASFLLVQLFSPSITYFGIANVFFFFSIASFISGVLSFIFVPETKGKTQDEVIEILETGIYYR